MPARPAGDLLDAHSDLPRPGCGWAANSTTFAGGLLRSGLAIASMRKLAPRRAALAARSIASSWLASVLRWMPCATPRDRR